MARKLQNIYEYLSEYTEDEIDDIIYDLPQKEKNLIKKRYGYDLYNPTKNNEFTTNDTKQFYNSLIPKIKRKINANKKKDTTELKKQILELIDNKKNNNEICSELAINTKTLYKLLLELKNEGIMITRKYYSDGSILYKKTNTFSALKETNIFTQEKSIITDSKENNIKFLIISDLHFGNKLERLDLMDKAYNYCITKGINYILEGGDLIDGTYTKGEQSISDTYKQIKYFIKNYPHDKNILTIGIAGDHDYSAFTNDSINIEEILNNFRHDVIIVGYNNGIINIKNDKIQMYHSYNSTTTMQKSDAPIILHGHAHKYKVSITDNSLNIVLPSLSNVIQLMPTALELDVSFVKGYMKKAIVKQLYFDEKDIILNEFEFDLIKNRRIINSPIKHIEAYKDTSITKTKTYIK